MTLAQETPVILLDEPTTFLDIAHQIALLELLAELRRLRDAGVAIVAAAPGGPAPDEIDWSAPTALVMGSEGQGVDAALLAEFPDRVSIPMASGVESLNVASAAGVIAFEAARQARIA